MTNYDFFFSGNQIFAITNGNIKKKVIFCICFGVEFQSKRTQRITNVIFLGALLFSFAKESFIKNSFYLFVPF